MNGLKTIKHSFQRWIYNNNIFAFILWTSLIVDAIYLVMFMLISQYILAVVSAFKIVVCISLLNKSDDNGKNSVSQMITFEIWVYGQMVLYTLFLGVESGFNMILLSMIPTVFFIEYLLRNSSMISYVTSGVICITNIVLISLNDRFAVKDAMNIVWKDIVQSFNWCIAIFLTVFSATIFMAEVFNISNGLEKQNRKLNVLANYDPLTELLLRRPMYEKIEECVQTKKLYGKEYAICIGDIDFFKKFNDKYGHECGDVVLKNVSRVIANDIGSNGHVCRWGGEEIMILLPDTTAYNASKMIERVRKDIEGRTINYKNTEVRVTMTFGVSSSEKYIMSKEVIEAADKALYEGKESGRNRVCSG